jgi:2-phosphosulfolactate phosphatase
VHIDVVHFPSGIEQARRSGTVAVIDVLRSTTVIAYALSGGAREIFPVQTASQARRLAAEIGPAEVVLGGEEGSAKIAGFHVGNSPGDYPRALVSGKTIVVRTTNGTQALRALDDADPGTRIVCAAFANLGAVVDDIEAHGAGGTATLVCCGQDGDFSLEDFLCAGAIANRLARRAEARLSDAAIAASVLFEARANDLGGLVATGNHARALVEAGFGDDVATCIRIDTCNVVPVYSNGRISGLSSPVQLT